MNYIENLLTCVGEECGEIQQAISKVARFGPRSTKYTKGYSNNNQKHDDYFNTNADHVLEEFYQLAAVIEMLQDERILPRYHREDILDIKRRKKNKVDFYYKNKTQIPGKEEDYQWERF